MQPITYEMVESIVAVYPELESIKERALRECGARNTFPALMRSLGRRDGLPDGLEWVFDDSPFRPPQASSFPASTNPVRIEAIPPSGWTDLISKLEAAASDRERASNGDRELLLDMLGELKSIKNLLSKLLNGHS